MLLPKLLFKGPITIELLASGGGIFSCLFVCVFAPPSRHMELKCFSVDICLTFKGRCSILCLLFTQFGS